MFNVHIRRLLVLVLSVFASTLAQAAELPPLTHGLTALEAYAAPPLRLPDLDDTEIDIGEFRGQVVVVNFWATWCPPCRREMPSLERLNHAVGDKGITVLAVNVGEDFEAVWPFMGTITPSPTFPLLFDADASTLDVWKVKGLPTTFVVNPEGRLAYRAIGGREFDHPELVKSLLTLTAQNSPAGASDSQ